MLEKVDFWMSFSKKRVDNRTERMRLVVKSSRKAVFTVLPHFVEKAALTRTEICRM